MLTAADYVILAIIAISALLSVLRGFVREAISLLAWVSAFMVTGNFYKDLSRKLTYFEAVSYTHLTLPTNSLV